MDTGAGRMCTDKGAGIAIDAARQAGMRLVLAGKATEPGTPVIALRGGSVPEVVAHEQTGFVFDNPSDLVKGIELAERIDPAACRAGAEALFDTSVMVSGYESIYRNVVERARAGPAPRAAPPGPREIASPG